MRFDSFCEKMVNFWNEYFVRVTEYQKNGKLYVTDNSENTLILFPTLIILTDCADTYVAELFGASKNFRKLFIKKSKGTSLNKYINQFSDAPSNPFFTFENFDGSFESLIIGPAEALCSINSRFSTSDRILTRLVGPEHCDSALGFKGAFRTILLNNFISVNTFRNAVRSKYIMNMVGVNRRTTPRELNILFEKIFPSEAKGKRKVYGIHNVTEKNSIPHLLVGQLQNLFLSSSVRETTIGEFFSHNLCIIRDALGAKSALYEKSFDWVEHDGTVSDKQINPDFMLENEDGTWTIVDLKTAALKLKSLTKGDRNRRRFVDYVYEGCAQLANYRIYFQFPKNAEFAFSKYGIGKISENCILIVGNEENANKQEITEAILPHRNVMVIDYDTLISMFLIANEDGKLNVNTMM